jgi:hypothetical protein
VFRFHSRDLHMVLGQSKNGTPVRFNVKPNGAAPGDDHGSDSGADGRGEVRQPRMYQLIRQKGPIKDVTFEIEFADLWRQGLFVHVWLTRANIVEVSGYVSPEGWSRRARVTGSLIPLGGTGGGGGSYGVAAPTGRDTHF